MTTIAVLALTVCVCVAATLAQNSRRFDSIDVDKVLASKRLVGNYIDCILGEKKTCSPQAIDLKETIPNSIKTKCSQCSQSDKDKFLKVVRKLRKDYPAEWKRVSDKFDPQGTLVAEFEQEMEKQKQG